MRTELPAGDSELAILGQHDTATLAISVIWERLYRNSRGNERVVTLESLGSDPIPVLPPPR
jgi:hypothetical protein